MNALSALAEWLSDQVSNHSGFSISYTSGSSEPVLKVANPGELDNFLGEGAADQLLARIRERLDGGEPLGTEVIGEALTDVAESRLPGHYQTFRS
jgi:hypothetical protein